MISACGGPDAGAGERQNVPPEVEQPPAEPEPAVHHHLLVVGAGRRDALLPRRHPEGAQARALSMQPLLRTNIQVPPATLVLFSKNKPVRLSYFSM